MAKKQIAVCVADAYLCQQLPRQSRSWTQFCWRVTRKRDDHLELLEERDKVCPD